MSRVRDLHTYRKMALDADEDPSRSPGHRFSHSGGRCDRRELCTIMPIDGEPPEVRDNSVSLLDDDGSWQPPVHQAPLTHFTCCRIVCTGLSVALLATLLAWGQPWAQPRAVGELDTFISDDELDGFVLHQGYNCWAGNGGDPVMSGDAHDPRSLEQCKLDCKKHGECQGVIMPHGADPGDCWLRKNVQLAQCNHFTAWDLWVRAEVDRAQQTTTRTTTTPPTTTMPPTGGQVGGPGSSPHSGSFENSHANKNAEDPQPAVHGTELASLQKLKLHAGTNCWAGNGADPMPVAKDLGELSLMDCKLACVRAEGCQGVVVMGGAARGKCWMRRNIDVSRCAHGTAWDLWVQPVQAPLHEFYMYRATAPGDFAKFPVGQINTANMDGLIWYLMNEVVTNYSKGSRCPRKFGISEIHRMKVRTRATPELAGQGMSFGARFAYDYGECMGRCFPNNLCTSGDDCEFHYRKYGFVPGCNRFADKWPFPNLDTATPGGIWYSLPLSGRCLGVPTGAKDCTWSFEDAGVVSLLELESLSHGSDNCCKGHCTNFWVDQYNPGAATGKVNQALDLFHKKYPAMPRDLEPAPCDFNRDKWYSPDTWPRRDPWR